MNRLEQILNKKFHIKWVFLTLIALMAVCVYTLSQLI